MAGLDVFAEEPAKDNVLFGMDQVVLTPHLGASTTEAQEKVALQIAEQMSDYLLTGAVANALNLPSVSAEEAPKLRPYMNLVGQLGGLLGQLADQACVEVAITYEGSVAGLNTKSLTPGGAGGTAGAPDGERQHDQRAGGRRGTRHRGQ